MEKTHLIASFSLLCLVAGIAQAGERHVSARVTSVEPIYATRVVALPVTTCQQEVVERRLPNPAVAGSTLAGAIVGAAIGRQFGDGSGRDALTVIGAVAGSAVANDRATRRHGGYRIVREPVERCTTEYRRHNERQLTGYWVEYRHRGRYYRVRTNERPGQYIHVVHRT